MSPTNKSVLIRLLEELASDAFHQGEMTFAKFIAAILDLGLSQKNPDRMLAWLASAQESLEANYTDDEWLADFERMQRRWSPN